VRDIMSFLDQHDADPHARFRFRNAPMLNHEPAN